MREPIRFTSADVPRKFGLSGGRFLIARSAGLVTRKTLIGGPWSYDDNAPPTVHIVEDSSMEDGVIVFCEARRT